MKREARASRAGLGGCGSGRWSESQGRKLCRAMVSEANGMILATKNAQCVSAVTQKMTGARPKTVSPFVLNRPSWGALCGGAVAH